MKRKILPLIAAGVCGFTTSSHASLVAWYKFDEGAGATTALNAVEGSSSGAIQTGVTTGLAGKSGNAYQFDNSAGYVDMGNASFFSSINTAQKLTISVWVNTGDTTGQNNVAVFAGNSTVNANYTDIGYSGAGDSTRGVPAGAAYARNRSTGNGTTAPGSFAIDDSQWHLLVLTLDLTAASNQLNLYVDGSLSSTLTLTGSSLTFPTFNSFNVGRLGRGGNGPTDYYGGLIDDVQVYDSALSASDIQFLYNNPGLAVVPEPGTVALVGLGLGLVCFTSRRKRKQLS